MVTCRAPQPGAKRLSGVPLATPLRQLRAPHTPPTGEFRAKRRYAAQFLGDAENSPCR